jgi:acetyl-CoA acetyltransferase
VGVFGELCVAKYGFSRNSGDAFAAESAQRALNVQSCSALKSRR